MTRVAVIVVNYNTGEEALAAVAPAGPQLGSGDSQAHVGGKTSTPRPRLTPPEQREGAEPARPPSHPPPRGVGGAREPAGDGSGGIGRRERAGRLGHGCVDADPPRPLRSGWRVRRAVLPLLGGRGSLPAPAGPGVHDALRARGTRAAPRRRER